MDSSRHDPDHTHDGRSDARPLALVTGASSGIGLELARQFADMAQPGSAQR